MMKKNRGFNLIELLLVVAIIGVISGIALPNFDNMLQRNRLKAAAQSLQDDMQFARTQAIKQSRNIVVSRVQTSANAGDWCYGITAKSSCTCTTANDCEIKTVSGADFGSVSMYSSSGNSTFDFKRGTIGANGVTFNTTKYSARVVFSDVGRVRICAPTTLPAGTVAMVSSC